MNPKNPKKFWEWKNQAESPERTLFLNGAIAEESWYDDDVTPELFKDELMSGTGPIKVWINSPGGDCVAAARIYNMMTAYPYNVTVVIDGLAASAASVIAMAGDKVVMSPVAMLMIHNPMTVAMGDKAEMEKAIAMLASVKDSIISAYEIKTGLSRPKLARLMDEETWMDARQAKQLGFCDEIMQRNGAFDWTEEGEDDDEDDTDDGDEIDESKETEVGTESEKESPEEDEKAKEATIAMLFSRRAVATSLSNKLHNEIVAKKAKEEPTKVSNVAQGRSVNDLKAALTNFKKII